MVNGGRMEREELKFTELDYLIGDHHLQMIKAALPYVQVSQQKFLSLLVKGNELMRTLELFQEGPEGEMGICSVEQDKISPIEMLNAGEVYPAAGEGCGDCQGIVKRYDLYRFLFRKRRLRTEYFL